MDNNIDLKMLHIKMFVLLLLLGKALRNNDLQIKNCLNMIISVVS